MRLQKYLNEEIDYEKIIASIEKDCQPFLKQMKASNFANNNNNLLYTGKMGMYDRFDKKKVRKNRKPKDTPEDIHEGVDDGFYENFGIRARSNTMFCTGEANDARGYGKLYIVFPIGKFEVIGSNLKNDFFTPAIMDRGFEYGKKNFLSRDSGTYKKGDLQNAIKSGNEIMLHCKEYYILRSISAVPVLDHFKDTLK